MSCDGPKESVKAVGYEHVDSAFMEPPERMINFLFMQPLALAPYMI